MKLQKEHCKKYFYKEFKFKIRKLINEQIENYFNVEQLNLKLPKHKYKLNDEVVLKKHHFYMARVEKKKAVEFVAQTGLLQKKLQVERRVIKLNLFQVFGKFEKKSC